MGLWHLYAAYSRELKSTLDELKITPAKRIKNSAGRFSRISEARIREMGISKKSFLFYGFSFYLAVNRSFFRTYPIHTRTPEFLHDAMSTVDSAKCSYITLCTPIN